MCQICTFAAIISDNLLQICEFGFAVGLHICPPEHIPEIGHNHEIAHLLIAGTFRTQFLRLIASLAQRP